MSSLQVDNAAGCSASAHRPDHDGLSEKEHINFIEPHMWPPDSPDINPVDGVDYAISGAHQKRVYHQRQLKTVKELKWAIVTEWQKLSQRFIDNSINEWRRRFGSCYQEWRRTHRALQLGLSSRTSFWYYREISLVNKTKHLTPIWAVVFILLGKVVT